MPDNIRQNERSGGAFAPSRGRNQTRRNSGEAKREHPSKALSPMHVTLFGIVKDVKSEHPLKQRILVSKSQGHYE